MSTNAEYHANRYTRGAVDRVRQLIQEQRELAEATNKSIAERRSELEKLIRDIDGDIMSAQTALERGQTTHFRAHLDQRNKREAARSRALRGRRGAGSELEKIRVKAREKMARAVDEAAALANANPELVWNQDSAFTTATQTPSIAAFLGQIGLEPGGGGVVSDDVRDAVTLGFNEGYNIGLRAYNFEPDPDEVVDAVRNITGVGQVTPEDLDDIKSAAGDRVVASAGQRSATGGMTDADVDAALEEAGLAGSMTQRQADIERMQQERAALVSEAAGLPSEVTEEDILQRAAGRMGDIGRNIGRPQNFIAVQRQLNEARRRLAAQEERHAQNEAQRAAIRSMSPAQRILMQASLDGIDLRQRHPSGLPPELTEQTMELSRQIANAMKNDPSLRGNDKAIVELAVHLAEQMNPDASVEQVRSLRDRILQGVVIEQARTTEVNDFVSDVDEVQFKPIDLEDIEVSEDIQFRQPEMVSIEEQTAPFEFQRPALSDIQVEQAPFAFSQQAFERMTDKEQKEAVRLILNKPELMFNQQGMTTLNSMSGSQDLFKHMNEQEIERFKDIRGRVRQQQIAQFELQPSTPELIEEPQGMAALPLDPELEENLLMQRAE